MSVEIYRSVLRMIDTPCLYTSSQNTGLDADVFLQAYYGYLTARHVTDGNKTRRRAHDYW